MIPKQLVGLILLGAVVLFGVVSVAAFATGLVTVGRAYTRQPGWRHISRTECEPL